MKIILLSLLFITTVFFQFCCKGPKKDYYKSGKIKKKVLYCKNKKDSLIKRYFKNGNIKSYREFENGYPNGKFKLFYNNGGLKAEGVLKKGELHGEAKHYFKNGKLKKVGHYKNGMENGHIKSYYKNGDLKIHKKVSHDTFQHFALEYSKGDGIIKDLRSNLVSIKNDTLAVNKKHSIKITPDGPIKMYDGIVWYMYKGNAKKFFNKGNPALYFDYDSTQYSVLIYNENDSIVKKIRLNNDMIKKKGVPSDSNSVTFKYRLEKKGKHFILGMYDLWKLDNKGGESYYNRNKFFTKFVVN